MCTGIARKAYVKSDIFYVSGGTKINILYLPPKPYPAGVTLRRRDLRVLTLVPYHIITLTNNKMIGFQRVAIKSGGLLVRVNYGTVRRLIFVGKPTVRCSKPPDCCGSPKKQGAFEKCNRVNEKSNLAKKSVEDI